MKSSASRVAEPLGPRRQVLLAVLARQRDAGLDQRAGLLDRHVLDGGADLDVRRRPARPEPPPPRSPRARARGWRAPGPGRGRGSAPPRHPRLAPRDAAVAPVGEEQRGVAADRAQAASWTSSTPGLPQLAAAIALRSTLRPSPDPGRGRRTRRGPPRRPRSSTGRRRARSRRRAAPRRRTRPPRPRRSPPASPRQPACSIADRARAGQRDRQAVGREHDRRHAVAGSSPGRRTRPARRRAARPARARWRRGPGGPAGSVRGATPARAATRSRFSDTAAGSSSVHSPRFSVAYGPADTPPRRVVKRTRAPGSGTAMWSPSQRNGAGRLT